MRKYVRQKLNLIQMLHLDLAAMKKSRLEDEYLLPVANELGGDDYHSQHDNECLETDLEIQPPGIPL